ncbi:SusC/RagA family TonB-linked outer membrane protein [Longitalea arenae]|uniref:SusC/RagA family TonB-linked outer membrane protein n=1 Tax=Longitalea arenae TaxID=2812558 RepID=UPI001967B8A9|nr:TonB-dependent receptor [Longitalea arenae]
MKKTKTLHRCEHLNGAFIGLLMLFSLLLCLPVFGQEARKLTGTVTDANGQPLAAINVTVQGTRNGVSTDEAGRFSLSVKPGEELLISGVGFQAQRIKVSDETNLSIKLAEAGNNLNEVVVIGYGTQKRLEVTGSAVRVGGSDLEKTHSTFTLQALQGQAAGVQVLSNSGQPGDAIKIRIRGLATNGNSDPLFVVDGMQTDDISYLNPADIETMDVLKDAASAAIYGTRGANGVVLITTKRGRSGKKTVTFDAFYGWQNPSRKMGVLNAKEYATIMNEAALNSGKPPYFVFSQAQIDSMGSGTDWQEEATNKNAAMQQYNLGFSGGNEQSTFAAGLSYMKQDGIVGQKDKSYYERIGLRLNSTHKLIGDIVRFGENLNYVHYSNSGIGTGNIYGNSIRGLLNTSPVFPVYNADGSFAKSTMTPDEMNPIAAMDALNNNKTIGDRIVGDMYLEATIVKGLTFKSDFGIDLTYYSTNKFIPEYNLATNNVTTTTTAEMGLYRNMTWNWDNTLTYQRSFGDHKITLMAGTTAQEYNGFNVFGSKQDLTIPDFDHAIIDNGKEGTQKATGRRVESALNAYFGRVNYNFADKYLFSAIIRRDGSTRFGSNNRYATFPSFSAGWVVTQEDFFTKPGFLNFFKIRGGWGKNGNDRIGDFLYMATLSSSFMGYYFGGINAGGQTIGTAPDKIPNPDLKWEAAEQTNIGFDATLFDKLNITFDWFNKATRDWLVQAKVPDVVGTGAPYINGGDIVNKGVELGLNYQRNFGQVRVTVGGNIAFLKNTVRAVPNEEGVIHGSTNVLSSNTEEFYRIQNGYPVGYFWGYQTAGLFQNQQEVTDYKSKTGAMIQPNALPGDVRFVDRNDDGQITVADKTQIGSPIPTHTYGINLSASWKGLDISLLLSGSGGNDIIDGTHAHDRYYNNYSTRILKRWHGEGTSTTIPRVTMGDEANKNYNNFSDLFVHNGAFMRLRNLNIGYDLKAGLLRNLPLQQLRFYINGTNLLTFTHYKGIDPEVGYGTEPWASGIDLGYYPQPRVISVGLSAKF